MTNKSAFKVFYDDTHGTFINKLFWIAGSFESKQFEDFLEEMSFANWKSFAPEIIDSKGFDIHRPGSETKHLLMDHFKLGLVAELHHPKCYNFSYNKKGGIIGCRLSMAVCRITIVYAEDLNQLIKKIKVKSEEIYSEYIKEDNKSK